MDDISAAVDKAASASPGSTPATPTSAPSSTATAAASSPATSAAGPGLGSTPSAHSKGVPATTQPSDADEELQSADWGDIPVERRQPILENARKKEAARVRTELLQSYGLTDDVEPHVLQSHINAIRTNPLAYYQWLGADLQRRGMIQPPPQQPRQPIAPKPERPQPSLRAEDGTAAYSQADMDALLKFELNEFRQSLTADIKPLQDMRREMQEREIVAQGESEARAEFEEAKTWTDFEELRPEIHRLMKLDGRRTLGATYATLHAKLLKDREATRDSVARQKVLAELKNAPDPTTVNPGQPLPSASKRGGKSRDVWGEALDHAIAAHAST